MATYVYETIPRNLEEPPRRFEVNQSMMDAPLTCHPDTGEPVKRIITGGFGVMSAGGKNHPATSLKAAPCSAGCACHNGPRLPQP